MRFPLLALVCALLVLPLAAGIATSGPFYGVASQGSSQSFDYQVTAAGLQQKTGGCHSDWPHFQIVTLSYTPASDVLTLHATGGDRWLRDTEVGANGTAELVSWPNYESCPTFTITVSGTTVAQLAQFSVAVDPAAS